MPPISQTKESEFIKFEPNNVMVDDASAIAKDGEKDSLMQFFMT
jgi:hypothetical protein